jgi:predicted nuclease of predicted toxin-antitoxin system
MKIRLYLDEDSMDQRLVRALQARGMDVTSALDQQMINRADGDHLDYATQQGRVLFSFNRGDFYELHTQYMLEAKSHAGIILANQQQHSIGEQMRRILRLSATRSA